MTPAEITSDFNAKKDEFRTSCEKTGMDHVLRGLGQMIGDLKASGIDVALDMLEMPSELAFKLFADGGKIVPLSGVLRVGGHHRLLALMIEFNNKPCLQLGVSRFDIRFQGVHAQTNSKNTAVENEVRSTVYDLKKNPDALIALQKDILHAAARTEIMQEYDVTNALGNSGKINKPLQKPPFKLGGAS